METQQQLKRKISGFPSNLSITLGPHTTSGPSLVSLAHGPLRTGTFSSSLFSAPATWELLKQGVWT